MASEQEVLAIKRRHSPRLLQLAGVCGFGVEKNERGDFVLAVHLDPTMPEAASRLPDILEGVPVKKLMSGPFLKQGS